MKRSLVRQFRKLVGPKRCLSEPEDLYAYSRDCLARGSPELVLLARTQEEISQILHLANQEGIPVTPRGAATGLSGMCTPNRGGIVLATNQMDRILEVNKEDRLAVVEAGVVTLGLHRAAEAVGLFYPPDPSSHAISLIGGNVASNAGGPRCLKYGVTSDYVMGLEVVLANGELLRTGSRAVKDVTGYDLTHLMCGSEGTLGVITKVTARLIPKPEIMRTMLVTLGSVEAASHMVSQIISAGILPTTLEFMDQAYIQSAENILHLGLPTDAAAMLLIEVDGFEESVERQLRMIQEFCGLHGALDVAVARDEHESQQLWMGRRQGSVGMMRSCAFWIAHDTTVPASRIPDLVACIHRLGREHDLKIVIAGHAGDGNIHPMFLFQTGDEEEMARFHQASKELMHFTVSCGGTLSGEHGVGIEKTPFLTLQVDEVGIQTMSAIKRALDPKGILNPGKFV